MDVGEYPSKNQSELQSKITNQNVILNYKEIKKSSEIKEMGKSVNSLS